MDRIFDIPLNCMPDDRVTRSLYHVIGLPLACRPDYRVIRLLYRVINLPLACRPDYRVIMVFRVYLVCRGYQIGLQPMKACRPTT